MSGDERTNGNAEALSFWDERSESAGDAAWRKWRASLEDARAGLAEWRAESAAWELELDARRAEADARVVEAEAESARLAVEAELAHAAFEWSLVSDSRRADAVIINQRKAGASNFATGADRWSWRPPNRDGFTSAR